MFLRPVAVHFTYSCISHPLVFRAEQFSTCTYSSFRQLKGGFATYACSRHFTGKVLKGEQVAGRTAGAWSEEKVAGRYVMLQPCQLGCREDSGLQVSCWLMTEKEERSRGGGGASRIVDRN